MPEKKQFAKRYDTKKEEFVIIKTRVDLERIENERFLNSQLNLIYSKLKKLQDIIAKGVPGEGAKECKRKIEELQKRAKFIESKIALYGVLTEEVAGTVESIEKDVDSLVSGSDIEKVLPRLDKMERTFGILSTGRIKAIFANLVDTVELLSGRVKNLEKTLSFLKQTETVPAETKAEKKTAELDLSDLSKEFEELNESFKDFEKK